MDIAIKIFSLAFVFIWIVSFLTAAFYIIQALIKPTGIMYNQKAISRLTATGLITILGSFFVKLCLAIGFQISVNQSGFIVNLFTIIMLAGTFLLLAVIFLTKLVKKTLKKPSKVDVN